MSGYVPLDDEGVQKALHEVMKLVDSYTAHYLNGDGGRGPSLYPWLSAKFIAAYSKEAGRG